MKTERILESFGGVPHDGMGVTPQGAPVTGVSQPTPGSVQGGDLNQGGSPNGVISQSTRSTQEDTARGGADIEAGLDMPDAAAHEASHSDTLDSSEKPRQERHQRSTPPNGPAVSLDRWGINE